jgi:hypothetical protein
MEIKHFCSLGTLCHSSQILKRNNLKKCSYPFDWIYSNCNTISHCLQNNFKNFLDKSYYIKINDMKCGHTYYHERMFNHHNPLNEKDYEYFTRCVDRFKNLLQTKESKLFILMYVNMNHSEIEESIKFNKILSNFTSNYKLLIIHHEVNANRKYIFEKKDNIHILYLYTLSESDGKEFKNEDDNLFLDSIINTYYTFKQHTFKPYSYDKIYIQFIKKILNIIKKIIKTLHPNQMLNLFRWYQQGHTLKRGIQKS